LTFRADLPTPGMDNCCVSIPGLSRVSQAACDFVGAAGNFSGGSSSEGLLGKPLSAGSAAGGSFGAAPRACSTIGFGGGGMCARGVAGGFARAGAGCGEGILFANNEKATMQNLNDRLASYLDKVRLLEGENADLECKIREWYAKVGPSCEPRDYSCFHKEIEDLQNQVNQSMETNKILLNIDNNRMTADDFRVKYETECGLRQNVDADICNLRPVLDQLASCKTDLQLQCEALTEEMCCLKTNHEEEMNCLRKQATGDVSVEVNTCPGPDLRKILEDLRCQYETLMERNRKETEQWYVNLEVITSSQEIESSNKQVTELRRQLQALEINVQAQLTMVKNLESSLAETECRYNKYLAELQSQISCVEQRLAEIRAEMECQNQEYKTLLDVKCRLEQEIQTYHCLLEGLGSKSRGTRGFGSAKCPGCEPKMTLSSWGSAGSWRAHQAHRRHAAWRGISPPSRVVFSMSWARAFMKTAFSPSFIGFATA
uniref:IF rod domain-containing protein n=1 Tax=Anser cygnoides TaxID=8845 RepID=A0A8B9DT03_ANSCY